MLPPTGDGSIAAERGRWTALAARETLRWRVWYAVEIALCIVVALGILWSAREVIAYARAPRGGSGDSVLTREA